MKKITQKTDKGKWMRDFTSNVSSIVNKLLDSGDEDEKSEYDMIASISSAWKDLSFDFGEDLGSAIEKLPLLKVLIQGLLKELPFLAKVAHHLAQDRHTIQYLHRVVENLLTGIAFVRVRLLEKISSEDLQAAAKKWGNEETLRFFIESKLRSQYGDNHLFVTLKSGSVMAECRPSFASLLRFPEALSKATITFEEFDVPPSFRRLGSGITTDSALASGIEKFSTTSHHVHNDQVSVLQDLGFEKNVAQDVIRKDLMDHYSIIHQLKNWLDQVKVMDHVQFANSFLKSDSEAYRQLDCFFKRFPDAISPSSWLFYYCSSRLSYTANVFPEDLEPGVVFQTTPHESSDVPPVNGILLVDQNKLGNDDLLAVLTELQINNEDGQSLWFHGTSWEFAKQILGDEIDVGAGARNLDFGTKSSFYVTGDFAHACEWARTKYLQPAVIIYNVSCQELEKLEGLDLSDENDLTDWENLVRGSRLNIPSRTTKDANNSNWVYGPEASFNPKKNNHSKWRPKPNSDPIRNQLALKSNRSSRLFDENAKGLLLLSTVTKKEEKEKEEKEKEKEKEKEEKDEEEGFHADPDSEERLLNTVQKIEKGINSNDWNQISSGKRDEMRV